MNAQSLFEPKRKPAPAPLRVGLLQRACACGQHTGGGECEECKKNSEGTLQRSATNTAPVNEIPPVVYAVLNSPGQPLDPTVRALMEPRFGKDFSQVRVHTGDQAAASAQALHARAYTVDQHIAFGAGEYAAHTESGQRLLAHELTHTLQQRNASSLSSGGLTIDPPNSPRETAASRAAGSLGQAGAAAAPAMERVISRAPQGETTCGPSLSFEEMAKKVPRPSGRKVPLNDEDANVCSVIDTESAMFRNNYIDYHIDYVDYWSTPFANQNEAQREFLVHYKDGRAMNFSIDQIGYRKEINKNPALLKAGIRQAHLISKPQEYIKRGGLIYPDVISDSSTPHLRDIATTIEYNHRQREKFLEIAEVTFTFAIILSSYAVPPEAPSMPRSSGGFPRELPRELPREAPHELPRETPKPPETVPQGGKAPAGTRGRIFEKTTVTGDPGLPPGEGFTTKYGDVTYSTQGSAQDVALAKAHESVHSALSPKLKFLRTFRANFAQGLYDKSHFLRYLEESLAETFAQLKVKGIKGFPTGIKFPITNGYVTVTRVVAEGAVGTITVGGITYAVYVNASN